MSWHWEPTWAEAAGTQDEPEDLHARFGSQGDAESWLGENYPELVAAGVAAVSLFEEDRLVYGPMDLTGP